LILGVDRPFDLVENGAAESALILSEPDDVSTTRSAMARRRSSDGRIGG
jgi:predicted aconitase with swiveling domain